MRSFRGKMTKEQFIGAIVKVLFDGFSSDFEGAVPSVDEVQKLGRTYTALTITFPGENIVPMIDMDECFQWFQDGMSLPRITDQVYQMALVRPSKICADDELMMDYDRAKEYLTIRVNNRHQNESYLENVPHRVVEDLALTCHVMFREDEHNFFLSTITYNLLQYYGITEEQLFEDAMHYGKETLKVSIKPIGEMIYNHLDLGYENTLDCPMLVVTNEMQSHGAGAFFLPGVMEGLSKLFKGDYYMLPSSVHEVLVLPEAAGDPHMLKKVVRDVNRDVLDPTDWLSDSVYRYYADSEKLLRV